MWCGYADAKPGGIPILGKTGRYNDDASNIFEGGAGASGGGGRRGFRPGAELRKRESNSRLSISE